MDDDETQQFSLRWHNHQMHRGPCYLKTHSYIHFGHDNTNGNKTILTRTLLSQNSVIGALGHMLSTGALSDVTLSASGTSLKAHRVVLAACSQYFAQIFKDVESDNTLVVVLGCEAAELRLLLTFMYTGEVTASKKCLPALLRLAHTLQVSGLTDSDTNSTLTRTGSESTTEPASPMNLEKIEPTPFEEKEEKQPEYLSEIAARNDKDRLSKLDQIVQNLYTTHKLGALSTIPSPVISSLGDPPDCDRKWRTNNSVCTICNKRLSNQYNLRVHMETHAGRRHACRACSHVSRSRDALRKHVAYRHAAHATQATTTHTRDRHA